MGGEADLLADLAHHVAEGLGALLTAEGLAAVPDRIGRHQCHDAFCVVACVGIGHVAVLEAANRLDVFEPLDPLLQSPGHSASTQPSLCGFTKWMVAFRVWNIQAPSRRT